MRFFDFYEGATPILDYKLKSLKEWVEELKSNPLYESSDAVLKSNEFRSFIQHYITDPADLLMGDMYYPIFVKARPTANLIALEIAKNPVKYLGLNNDNFVFQGSMTFQLPKYEDTTEDIGPYFLMTTVYATADERNQFISMIALKFEGKWRIEHKSLTA